MALRATPGRLPHVRDFADLDDEAFVEAAYRIALRRPSDPGGSACYRELLTQGASRVEILTYLVDSPEGRGIGSRIEGLTWARRRARMSRLPILRQLFGIGRRLSPWTALRRDLRTATRRLVQMTDRMQTLEVEAKQRDQEALHRFDRLRSEFMQSLATRADIDSLASLQAAVADLSTQVTQIHKVEQSKADLSELDRRHEEWQSTLYRGIDDVDRKFRMLLDGKADVDAVSEVGAAFDNRLQTLQQELERQVQALEARKTDTSVIDATRAEMLAALRGIEDVDKSFRALLEGKAGTDAVSEVGAALENKLQLTRRELECQVQAVNARKADAGAIDAARNEMHAALRAALTGLTASVSAVAASRVDRATMNAMMAENSQTIRAQFQDSVRQLRSSIEELSAR